MSDSTPEPSRGTVVIGETRHGKSLFVSSIIRERLASQGAGTETIQWWEPKDRKPQLETTVLLNCADGEIVPGKLTVDSVGREVWRRENWPAMHQDLTELEILTWAEWPHGPYGGSK